METLSPEQYLINKAKAAQGRDVYEAKSWIITAKTLFPKDFFIQFESFLQEKSEQNLEAAARSFSFLVSTFQHQPLLWAEIAKLTTALRLSSGLTEEEEFYLKMFQHISYEGQILVLTANHMENSLDHCRLILLLMKRFPQAISQHSRCLLETLINGIGTANSHQYRDMLINEAMPLILQKPGAELPSNLLNVVIGITIEHYVEQMYRVDDETFVAECWRRIYDETLELCGRLLHWEKFVSYNRNYGKDVYWTRLVQIVASAASPSSAAAKRTAVDSKQIFYTSIVVFIHSLQDYMSNVSRKERNGEGGRLEFVLVEALRDFTPLPVKRRHSETFGPDAVKIIVAEPCRPETPNCLITAAHCWQLMNSNELLQRESNQLLVRLPIGEWVTRFISDLAVYLGRPDDFQAILKTASVRDGLEKDIKLLSLAVMQNNLSTAIVGPLIVTIVKELAQSYSSAELPQGEYLKELTSTNVVGGGRQLILLPMTKRAILQYCVSILVAKLSSRMQNLLTEPSDAVLGYLLVLLQLNWPNGSQLALQIFNRITTKRSFTFLPFSKYIILTDFVEEFAYLWSQVQVNLELSPSAKAPTHMNTRRADKGVKDDFKQIMRDQIVRSHEDIDFLVILFILQSSNQIFNEIPM